MIWLNGKVVEFGKFPNGEIKMNEEQIKLYCTNCKSNIPTVSFKKNRIYRSI